jgi:tricorn protease
MSYRGRPPLSNLPVVVLCGHESSSNAEIFTHAFKELKRGKVVGETTGGKVIATSDVPLLDYGKLRRAHIGWFNMDGTDMENHGAVPDVEIPLTPADIAAGRDPQLEAAIEALKDEAAAKKPLPPLRYAPAD